MQLNATDETPRYLGPSSGITMTRLLMEEAKRYTESKRIAELIPSVRERRLDRSNRMQSVVATMDDDTAVPPAPGKGRRVSYAMTALTPAPHLVTRPMADRLMEIFIQRGGSSDFPSASRKLARAAQHRWY